MKHLFVILAVVTLLASCNSASTETEVTTTDSISVVADTCQVDTCATVYDTLSTK